MSVDNAALSFGVIDSQADSQAGYLSKQLKAGLGQTDAIDSLEGSAYYTFEAEGDSLNTLYVNLVPIHGKFRLSVRNDGSKPTINQTYWTSDSNSLAITDLQTVAGKSSRFVVGVFSLEGIQAGE